MYDMKMSNSKVTKKIFQLALGSSYFLLFGNEMLLTSIYFSAITTTWVSSFVEIFMID